MSARYSYGRYAQTRGSDALFDLTPANDKQSSFIISLSLPFFNNYFQNTVNIARANVTMDNADDIAEQRQILLALGGSALDEHAEWILLHRDRSVDQGEILRMGS